MNAPLRVLLFTLAVVAVFVAAAGVGARVGPVGEPAEASHAEDAGHGQETHGADKEVSLPGGLMVSAEGYTLVLGATQVQPGPDRQVSFRIEGPDGPVTAYDVEHEKRLHLIAVRRDFTGFQHVHPTLADDGTWSTGLDLSPGPWRVFADFKPTGAESLTLGTDLSVPGPVAPSAERAETRVARVDGYTVTLTGDLVPGEHSELRLGVTRDGRPVTDLDPYLGAFGHLVALREGDLAYLHVHPDGEPGDGVTAPGPDVEFAAEVPSAGGYHLFLDFKHDGVVRTAQLALDARAER